MAIVAVMMVVGFSAFKVVENTKTDPVGYIPWYFTGNDEDDVLDKSFYEKEDENDPQDCSGNEIICVIIAPEDSNQEPDLNAHIDPLDTGSPTISQLIEQAMDESEENDGVKSLRYF